MVLLSFHTTSCPRHAVLAAPHKNWQFHPLDVNQSIWEKDFRLAYGTTRLLSYMLATLVTLTSLPSSAYTTMEPLLFPCILTNLISFGHCRCQRIPQSKSMFCARVEMITSGIPKNNVDLYHVVCTDYSSALLVLTVIFEFLMLKNCFFE